MSDSYTRGDLAADLSQKEGCSVEKARGTIETIIQAVSRALAGGRKVEFRGFGVLEVIRRKEKVGRNPKNPEQGTYQIPPRNVVKFRTGKELDETLNREGEAAVSA
jgi:integration host factor subunit beta